MSPYRTLEQDDFCMANRNVCMSGRLQASHPPLHTSTSKHRKSIRKPGVLRAEMMEESESGQKPGESGVRKGNPG